MREFIPTATRFIELPDVFVMKRGGKLHGARIAYETFGEPNEVQDNVILILTGLSPDAHVASNSANTAPGWWEAMLGPGKPIDTNRWYVICVNSLGSCKGSTGPASIDPTKGTPYRLEFPELSMEDIADAAAFTIYKLGFERLACVIGTSMGGMSSLALLSRHPSLASSHINISGAVHTLPFAIAIRSLQREAITVDPNWNQGNYDDEYFPVNGMVTARKLGMITYRSAQEWERRFGRTNISTGYDAQTTQFGLEFAVESYLEKHAHRFLRNFDPNCYLYLSRCIDRFDLGALCGDNVDEALSGLCLDKALVIGVETDILFPLHQQQKIADGLRSGGTNVQFLPLQSSEGHDAFLVDIANFGPPVANFLATL